MSIAHLQDEILLLPVLVLAILDLRVPVPFVVIVINLVETANSENGSNRKILLTNYSKSGLGFQNMNAFLGYHDNG